MVLLILHHEDNYIVDLWNAVAVFGSFDMWLKLTGDNCIEVIDYYISFVNILPDWACKKFCRRPVHWAVWLLW